MVVAQRLVDELQIQPACGRDDHQHIAGPGAHRQRLEHLIGVDAERARLVDGGVGLTVREHVERGTTLLEVLGDDRHHNHLPGAGPGAARWTPSRRGPRGCGAYRTRWRRRCRALPVYQPAS